MKRLLPAILLFMFIGAHAQDADSLARKKSRWGGIPIPIISYNSDFGFEYGAMTDIYDYGAGRSEFPGYRHKFHIEAAQYTKGESNAAIEYDSSHLIEGLRLTATIAWQDDPMYPFFGFGGDVTAWDPGKDKVNNVAYYDYRRSFVRMNVNVLGNIRPHLRWIAGASLWDIRTSDFNFKDYDPGNTLYNDYIKAGVIKESERGGTVFELRGGIMYDSRDFEPEPMSGTWAEAYLIASPSLNASTSSYVKFAAHARQYFTPGPDWLTLAYHAATQLTLLGEAPFYMQQNIYNVIPKQVYAEGLGGSNTVRGLLPSRLLGDGYAWANFELRARVFRLKILGFDFAGSINPFVDCGMIVQPRRLNELSQFTGKTVGELRSIATKPHASAGIGLKGAVNRNLILSVEVAKPFNPNDGRYTLVLTTNHVF